MWLLLNFRLLLFFDFVSDTNYGGDVGGSIGNIDLGAQTFYALSDRINRNFRVSRPKFVYQLVWSEHKIAITNQKVQ